MKPGLANYATLLAISTLSFIAGGGVGHGSCWWYLLIIPTGILIVISMESVEKWHNRATRAETALAFERGIGRES